MEGRGGSMTGERQKAVCDGSPSKANPGRWGELEAGWPLRAAPRWEEGPGHHTAIHQAPDAGWSEKKADLG